MRITGKFAPRQGVVKDGRSGKREPGQPTNNTSWPVRKAVYIAGWRVLMAGKFENEVERERERRCSAGRQVAALGCLCLEATAGRLLAGSFWLHQVQPQPATSAPAKQVQRVLARKLLPSPVYCIFLIEVSQVLWF